MKMFMKTLVSFFVIAVMFTVVPFESTCEKLEKDVLRLHILANSDESYDQKLKYSVRDEVIKTISPLYNDCITKEDAIKVTGENLKFIENTATKVINDNGYDYEVNARITNKFFDTRYYDEFTMPAGMYDTLEITIGEAKGKNWWCVMYPSLCVGASSKISMKEDLDDDEYDVITSSDVVYKFKVVEYYEKLCAFFS